MSVSIEDVSADVGEVYDSVQGGSTAVTRIIERANKLVATVAGTTSGNDVITRPLADAMVVNQVLGGVDSVNKTIGSLSLGAKDLKNMQNYFQNEASKAAILKGYSLDGLRILFKDCMQ